MPPPYAGITAGAFFAGLAAGMLAWRFTGELVLRLAGQAAGGLHSRLQAWRARAPPLAQQAQAQGSAEEPLKAETPEEHIARLTQELAALEEEITELQAQR